MTHRAGGIGLALLAAAAVALALHAYRPLLDNYYLCDDFAWLQTGDTIVATPGLAWHQQTIYEQFIGGWRRPLANLMWAGMSAAFGHDPAPRYALAIAIHLASGLLLGCWLRLRTGDGAAAVLAGSLFITSYGVRDAVCWLSALNEAVCLPLALGILILRQRMRPGPGRAWLLAGLLVAGGLMKESLVPVAGLLAYLDWLDDAESGRAGRPARRWLGPLCLVGLFMLWRLSGPRPFYSSFALGRHLPANAAALTFCAFGSDLPPVLLARRAGVPELVLPLALAVWLLVLWTALRGPRKARPAAVWTLLQPLAYAPLAEISPLAVPSRYLYLVSAPACGLVALGLVAAWRSHRLVALLLALLIVRWQAYGLWRLRLDEARHYDTASRLLRRDFAALDAAALPAYVHILLLMPSDEVPAGGTWWGWEGYPVVATRPVAAVVRHVGDEPMALPPQPYAVFRYSKEQGPRLVGSSE